MTALEKILGRKVEMAEVKERILKNVGEKILRFYGRDH
jgi:hypothetical protein